MPMLSQENSYHDHRRMVRIDSIDHDFEAGFRFQVVVGMSSYSPTEYQRTSDEKLVISYSSDLQSVVDESFLQLYKTRTQSH